MHSEKIKELLEETHSSDAKVRKASLLKLCPCHVRNNVSEVWERIMELRSDPDSGVRSIVLHNLCDGSPSAMETQVVASVEAMQNDPDPKLRRRARRAMAVYRRTGVINQE